MRSFDAPSANVDTARLVTALVGALPERRIVRDDFGAVWQTEITADLTDGLDPAALSAAQQAYDRCRNQPEIRQCLISRHRELMQRAIDLAGLPESWRDYFVGKIAEMAG